MNRCFFFLIIFLFSAVANNCFSQPVLYKHWAASWISDTAQTSSENSWTCFVKDVAVNEKPVKPLIARIAVDSKYWLWINGKSVVFEGGLKRGPTPKDTYFDEVDISSFLNKGKNTIAVLVWYWGKDGFCHKSSGRMGLLFDAPGNDMSILSDGTWKFMTHPAFGKTSEPFPNYRLPEFNIKFYAGRDIPDWKEPGSSSGWQFARVMGQAGTDPWNQLWNRPFPEWKNSGLVDYETKIIFPFISDGNRISMNLPQNYSITPYLSIEAAENNLIDIRTDNYKGGSEYNVRTEYLTRKGKQEFETFGYMNGHEVIYSIPKGIRVLGLKYRRTSFPSEHVGTFVCDNKNLNRLYEKCVNTMDINMRDAIQDPDRERSQWAGDAVIILGQILYTSDQNGPLAIKKFISNIVEWQKTDSTLFSPVPAGNWDRELPTQMLATVGEFGFWRYFQYTGDTAMIAYVYPHVKKYIDVWKTGDDGLVVHRDGGWNWYDWGKNIDGPVIENAWFYLALRGIYQMALILGKDAEANVCFERMSVFKQKFNKQFWHGQSYRSVNYPDSTDDRAQALTVVAGLADTSQYKAIENIFRTEYHSGPYLEKYVLEALFQMDAPEQAMKRMNNRYAKMIRSNISTLWEGWGIGEAEYGGGSYNHGWSGGPLTLMHQYIAGITPLDAGFKTFSVKPMMGKLKYIRCTTSTIRGKIILNMKRDGSKLFMELKVPAGTTAIVGLQETGNEKSRIFVNNKRVADNHSGREWYCYFIKRENSRSFFQLPAGKWLIEQTR